MLQKRLLSLDLLRGLIMILLALEAAGLYHILNDAAEGSWWHHITIQFRHHKWNGLRFWDLIQPGFMFIAGTAMAYSLNKQLQNGVPWAQSFRKALKRSGWLFFWGVLNYAVKKDGLSFELWNVLTQLSFTLLVAFLIFRLSIKTQTLICVGILLLTEALYRFTNIPGFDQPFTDQHNFGNYVDLLLMNKINGGGWVAINCIPTAVHTIAGALAGKLMLSASTQKVKQLLIWGAVCLAVGFGLDWLHITPIIKRIATSSFTLASLGWCLLALAACYWWIDIRSHRKYLLLFTVIGMNSIFIYLFFEIVGKRWFNEYAGAITNGLMSMAHFPQLLMDIITCFTIFALEWGLCYFLYKKKIFFKL
jgi:predicted acyltransferase